METNELRARFLAWTKEQREEFRKRIALDMEEDDDRLDDQLDALDEAEEREIEQDRAEDVE